MDDASALVVAFDSDVAARDAVRNLEAAGFSHDQLGMIHKDTATGAPTDGEVVGHDHGAAAGKDAAGGVVVGGILGAAASLVIPGAGPVIAAGIIGTTLLGAATGAVTGGVLGALTGLGVPIEEAEGYNRDFESGRTLVTVKETGARRAEAEQILRQGALAR